MPINCPSPSYSATYSFDVAILSIVPSVGVIVNTTFSSVIFSFISILSLYLPIGSISSIFAILKVNVSCALLNALFGSSAIDEIISAPLPVTSNTTVYVPAFFGVPDILA